MNQDFYATRYILLSSVLILSSISLINTVISLKFRFYNISTIHCTVVSISYFMGMFLGILRSVYLINKIGYVKTLLLSLFIAINIIIGLFTINIFYFFVIFRIIQGIITSLTFVVIESCILSIYDISSRGKALALYMIILYISYCIGQIFLVNNSVGNSSEFHISILLIIISIISLFLFYYKLLIKKKNNSNQIKDNIYIYAKFIIGIMGCFISGLFVSIAISSIPIYIHNIFKDIKCTSLSILTMFLMGSIVQYPIGIIIDSFDKMFTQVIMVSLFTITLFFNILYILLELNINYFIISFIFFIGLFSFIIYPINTNIICNNHYKMSIIHGIETAIMSYSIGSIIGPLYISLFIRIFGVIGYQISYITINAIFIFLIVILNKL